MKPTRNRSTVLQCLEHINAIEIRNGIMLDFYPGLPHSNTWGIKKKQGSQVDVVM